MRRRRVDRAAALEEVGERDGRAARSVSCRRDAASARARRRDRRRSRHGRRAGDGAAATIGAAPRSRARPTPSPAAYRPHSAWLNATTSPSFGWLVNSDTTSRRSPRTSSTKPCSAFFGPTSTKTRAPAAYSVSQALHELHRRGDLPRQDVEHLRRPRPAPSGRTRRSRWRRSAAPAAAAASRSRRARSGSLAGRHDRVWKAWLTGSGTALYPAACEARRSACSTAALAPPITAWLCAVDVGDDDVAVDAARGCARPRRAARTPPPSCRCRRPTRLRHLAAARAHRLERVGERQRAGRDQRAVLAQAVAHHHVGRDAVGGEQPGERDVGRPARRAA